MIYPSPGGYNCNVQLSGKNAAGAPLGCPPLVDPDNPVRKEQLHTSPRLSGSNDQFLLIKRETGFRLKIIKMGKNGDGAMNSSYYR